MQAKADNTTTTRGREAERLAAQYLEAHGQRLVERNFRVRGGEIDLICLEGRTLVFIEVRLRSRADFGGAGASITASKRRRLIMTAHHYLARHRFTGDCRFDCILMSGLQLESIEWIRDAFSADA